MILKQLIDYLIDIQKKHGDNAFVNVLIEVDEDNKKNQYEFPANDIAYNRSSDTVIIMHEKWESSSEE